MTAPIDDGGPAFPCEYRHHEYTDAPHLRGMTLRDWFAGQALAGMLATEQNGNGMLPTAKNGDTWQIAAAKQAYSLADAMLAARKEPAK